MIDVHAHIIDRDYIDALIQLKGLRAETGSNGQTLLRRDGVTHAWIRDEMFDVAHALRKMDELGVERRLLSLTAPSIYDWPAESQAEIAQIANNALLTRCEAHPDRFSALVSLPFGSGADAALNELERTRIHGIAGVAVGSNLGGIPLDDPRFERVWARIDELQMPVVEHPMLPASLAGMDRFELPIRLGFVFDTTLAATRLIYSGALARYPNIPFVMAHTGGALLTLLERLDNGYRIFPDCREHIDELPSVYASRLYYDTCSFDPEVLRTAIRIAGIERLMWGSDDPFIGADAAHVRAMALEHDDTARILHGNARRLFNLP